MTYFKHTVICIFNENKEEYKTQKTMSNIFYIYFNMGEMDKSRELYSREGDNSRRFEGKKGRGNTLLETLFSLLELL